MDTLKTVVKQTYQMAIHAKGAHWNVTGPDFPMLHAFFGELYEELTDALDVLAEDLRTLNEMAPADSSDLTEGHRLTETTDATALLKALTKDNQTIIKALGTAYQQANANTSYPRMIGIANRLQDRLLAHAKHGWMLKATLEGR